MNVIKVYGGLGNQFFQYALGRMQMENGITVKFNIDWFNNPKNNHRPFILDKFNTKLQYSHFLPQRDIREEGKVDLTKVNLTKINGANFYGYWQNPKYFESILPILKKEFKLKPEYWDTQSYVEKEDIQESESVSIHIRRGDFIGKVNILSMQYYLGAQSIFDSIVPPQQFEYFIFSDDPEWCKQNFGSSFNYIYEDCWRDFELMRLCKHNIIANSTFSWWVAMLNDNLDKVVIAPKQWRLTQEAQDNMNINFLQPEGWLLL
jgi:hypothetical protein